MASLFWENLLHCLKRRSKNPPCQGGNDRLKCYLTLKLLPKFWEFFEINFLPLSLIILYVHLRLLIKYLKLLIHDSDDKLGTTFNIIPWYYISGWGTCIQCYPYLSHVTFIFVKHISDIYWGKFIDACGGEQWHIN